MNAYLVERFLPGVSEAELRAGLERVQAACTELSAEGMPIRYEGSMFLALEETCFCRFRSERADTAVAANERAQLPFARVTPAIVIAPDDLAGADAREIRQ